MTEKKKIAKTTKNAKVTKKPVPKRSPKHSESLRKFIRANAESYLAQPNINSIGIGYKIVDGKRTDQISIQFTVDQKVELETLETMETQALPSTIEIDGVSYPTDVIQREYVKDANPINVSERLQLVENRKSFSDPIIPGTSIGHPTISAGTAGGVVYDSETGEKYILSNWHVLQGREGKVNDNIVQPGAHDDNRVNQNIVGKLVRSHLGVAGDCAIAKITERGITDEILELGNKIETVGEPELGDNVVKSGRTTGVTYGIVTRVDTVSKINYGTRTNPNFVNIGCFEIEPDTIKPARNNEISMGGDSGSAWMHVKKDKTTNMILGLHFAGETGDARDHALACYSSSVFEKLSILPAPIVAPEPKNTRRGFSTKFVGSNVFLPKPLNVEVEDDLLEVKGETVFHYTHFSLAMSQSRKLARWVAWNIDGGSIRKISRKGINFKKDSRIPASQQLGNEIYRKNPLDRGHIARRADIVWGPMLEAKSANKDSFHYTNIAPQHEDFNQSSAGGMWGLLENAVFEDVDVTDLKVSVIGGPIFTNSDPEFRSAKLPKSFWKIIYFTEEGRVTLRAKAFVLTQDDLINGLETLDLPDFSVFEVSINKLQNLTDLDFKNVRRAKGDTPTTESFSPGTQAVRKISRRKDIVW